MSEAFDIIGAVVMLLGALLSLFASVGLLRFPDVLVRMHAATKPQTMGLVLMLVGLGLALQSWQPVGLLVLTALFQFVTSPVAAHVAGRGALRTGQVRLPVYDFTRDTSTTTPPAHSRHGAGSHGE